jgi:hypothetical protein
MGHSLWGRLALAVAMRVAAVPIVFGQSQIPQAPEFVGPTADVIRPGERPMQARALKLPAGVNRKWLQDDLDLIWSVRRALPPKPTETDLVRLQWENAKVEETDLGLGLRRRQRRAGGGHLSCDATAVAFEGALTSMRVSCWGALNKPKAVVEIIERSLGAGFRRVPVPGAIGYVTYRADYEFPPGSEKVRAMLDRRLGPLLPVQVPPDLAAAYARLMSPQEELAVGTNCGEGGEPPAGAEEVKALRSSRRFDLLRNVLRGPNPEARVYALKALRQTGVSAGDRAAIEAVSALPLKITTCSGCAYFHATTSEALKELE